MGISKGKLHYKLALIYHLDIIRYSGEIFRTYNKFGVNIYF